ncbi:MAG: hypothetical protein JXA20_09040 [Spirochaetes bacterium]|nr:hypothetical protein [Spirochaetota bacterium]
MNTVAVNQQQSITEGIQRMNDMLKGIVATGMDLQEKMLKVNVAERVSETTGIGGNIDVEA